MAKKIKPKGYEDIPSDGRYLWSKSRICDELIDYVRNGGSLLHRKFEKNASKLHSAIKLRRHFDTVKAAYDAARQQCIEAGELELADKLDLDKRKKETFAALGAKRRKEKYYKDDMITLNANSTYTLDELISIGIVEKSRLELAVTRKLLKSVKSHGVVNVGGWDFFDYLNEYEDWLKPGEYAKKVGCVTATITRNKVQKMGKKAVRFVRHDEPKDNDRTVFYLIHPNATVDLESNYRNFITNTEEICAKIDPDKAYNRMELCRVTGLHPHFFKRRKEQLVPKKTKGIVYYKGNRVIKYLQEVGRLRQTHRTINEASKDLSTTFGHVRRFIDELGIEKVTHPEFAHPLIPVSSYPEMRRILDDLEKRKNEVLGRIEDGRDYTIEELMHLGAPGHAMFMRARKGQLKYKSTKNTKYVFSSSIVKAFLNDYNWMFQRRINKIFGEGVPGLVRTMQICEKYDITKTRIEYWIKKSKDKLPIVRVRKRKKRHMYLLPDYSLPTLFDEVNDISCLSFLENLLTFYNVGDPLGTDDVFFDPDDLGLITAGLKQQHEAKVHEINQLFPELLDLPIDAIKFLLNADYNTMIIRDREFNKGDIRKANSLFKKLWKLEERAVRSNKELIESVASMVCKDVDYEKRFSAGEVGALAAFHVYDWQSELQFSTHVFWYIRQSIFIGTNKASLIDVQQKNENLMAIVKKSLLNKGGLPDKDVVLKNSGMKGSDIVDLYLRLKHGF